MIKYYIKRKDYNDKFLSAIINKVRCKNGINDSNWKYKQPIVNEINLLWTDNIYNAEFFDSINDVQYAIQRIKNFNDKLINKNDEICSCNINISDNNIIKDIGT